MGPWLPSEAPQFDSQLNAAQNEIERLQANPIDIGLIIIATCWLAKTFSSRACESRQLDSSETEHNTAYNVMLK